MIALFTTPVAVTGKKTPFYWVKSNFNYVWDIYMDKYCPDSKIPRARVPGLKILTIKSRENLPVTATGVVNKANVKTCQSLKNAL